MSSSSSFESDEILAAQIQFMTGSSDSNNIAYSIENNIDPAAAEYKAINQELSAQEIEEIEMIQFALYAEYSFKKDEEKEAEFEDARRREAEEEKARREPVGANTDATEEQKNREFDERQRKEKEREEHAREEEAKKWKDFVAYSNRSFNEILPTDREELEQVLYAKDEDGLKDLQIDRAAHMRDRVMVRLGELHDTEKQGQEGLGHITIEGVQLKIPTESVIPPAPPVDDVIKINPDLQDDLRGDPDKQAAFGRFHAHAQSGFAAAAKYIQEIQAANEDKPLNGSQIRALYKIVDESIKEYRSKDMKDLNGLTEQQYLDQQVALAKESLFKSPELASTAPKLRPPIIE